MPTPDDNGQDRQLRDILAPLEDMLVKERGVERAIRDELEEVTEGFRERIRASRGRQNRIERTLRSADALPEAEREAHAKTRQSDGTRQPRPGWRPSMTGAALNHIRKVGETTVNDLTAEFKISKGTAEQIVATLRAEGKVRLAGARPHPDRSRIYKPLPEESNA